MSTTTTLAPAPAFTAEEELLARYLHGRGVETERDEKVRLKLFIHATPPTFDELTSWQRVAWCQIARELRSNPALIREDKP